MVDQALQVLYLHILWKARALTNAPDPSPDEIAFREKLKEQRGTLLARLREFAVGTQSNTAEGVRRAVRIRILGYSPRADVFAGFPKSYAPTHSVLSR